jgi:hypothetical protein
VRDAVLTDQLDDGSGIHDADHDRGATEELACRRPASTSDVEEGHRGHVHGVGGELPDLADHRCEREEVVVREHHALRETSRAAGVQLEGDVVVRGRNHRVAQRLSRHPRIPVLVGPVPADDQDQLGVREIRRDCIDNRGELGADDENLRLGVVDDVLDLGCGEAPVDVDAHGVEERGPVEHLEVGDAVHVEEGNTVLVAHAGGREAVGHALRALVQVRP